MQALLEKSLRNQTRTLCKSIKHLQATADEAHKVAHRAMETVTTLQGTVGRHHEQLQTLTSQLGALQRQSAASAHHKNPGLPLAAVALQMTTAVFWLHEAASAEPRPATEWRIKGATGVKEE
eukprot:2420651-Amphidinium_carterae.1